MSEARRGDVLKLLERTPVDAERGRGSKAREGEGEDGGDSDHVVFVLEKWETTTGGCVRW